MNNPDILLQKMEDLAGQFYILCEEGRTTALPDTDKLLYRIHGKADTIRKHAASLRYSGALSRFKDQEWGSGS